MAIRKREKWYWFLGFQYRFPRPRIWVSLLVTAPIYLVGAFLTIRDAVLPRVYGEVRIAEFLPSFYWYWHWYVILALVYVIVLLLFLAPAANRFTLERQTERNDEKLRRYKRQLERSFESVGAPRELSPDVLRKTYELIPLQSNLGHPFEGSVEDVHESDYGVITRGCNENGKNFRAVIATYTNNPDTRSKRRIIRIDGVTAELSYVSFDGVAPIRAHHGAWLSEKARRVDFEVSGRRDLIVSTLEGEHVYAVERETTGAYPNGITNRTKLPGDLYKVRVRLVDSFGAVLDDYEMMLTITREPELKISLLSAKYWIRFHLHDLAKEGHGLLVTAYQITTKVQTESIAAFQAGETDVAAIRQREKETETREASPLAAKAKEWEERAGKFLGLHLSEKEKESIVNAKPSIDDGLNRVRKHPFERLMQPSDKPYEPNWTLIDSLKVRMEKLDKISSNH